MDQQTQAFLEEASDLVANIEVQALNLESDPSSQDFIQDLFRSMHTLKGAANMFGYLSVGELAHRIENIYDSIRGKDLAVPDGVISITLETADYFRELMNYNESDIPKETKIRVKEFQLSVDEAITEVTNLLQSPLAKLKKTTDKEDPKLYHLRLTPNPDIFTSLNLPLLYVIDEIFALGEVQSYACKKNLPGLEEYDPEICYIEWEFFIYATVSESDIEEIFIFVLDNCTVKTELVHKGTELKTKELFDYLDGYFDFNQGFKMGDIRKVLTNFEHSKARPDKEASSRSFDLSTNTIKVSSNKIEELMNWVSELVTIKAAMKEVSSNFDIPEINATMERMEVVTDHLRDTVLSVSLVPVKNILVKFQRLIRELSRDLQKEVNFQIEGAETELDKNIIEKLSDPLLHIFRNSIDHGLENAEERTALGKKPIGNITFRSYYSGSHVVIEIEDDGKGINTEAVKQKAIEKGLVGESDNLSKEEMLNLIFAPGFSTSQNVTNVSGRGVGMDVVKKKIGELRGGVTMESTTGQGTKTIIKLPLTLSIIDGLLVEVGDLKLLIMVSSISRCYTLSEDQMKQKDDFNNTLVLDGEHVTIIDLHHALKLEHKDIKRRVLVTVEYADKKYGLILDRIIGDVETVLKPLGEFYRNEQFISGATILGDGTLALVLDTDRLVYEQSIEDKELQLVVT